MIRHLSFPVFLLLHLLFSCTPSPSGSSEKRPYWQVQELGRDASIRGLCAVDEQIAWLSGSENTIARTVDGGRSWELLPPPSSDTLDFRDIQAFDERRALVMSAGPGALSRIYRTNDGGQSWQLTLQNELEAGFFNGFAFWDEKAGILTGDPVDGALFVALTEDGGRSWRRVAPENLPPVDSLEYGFAASGSHIAVAGDSLVWIGTGGHSARIFRSAGRGASWEVFATPMISGKASTGIFSLTFTDEHYGIAVGGDYTDEELVRDNIMVTADGGRSWKLIDGHGVPYRSCVKQAGDQLLTAGPSGTDVSYDRGRTWERIDTIGYHVISVGAGPNAVWVAGAEGRIGKLAY